jgi:uncharacterized repeat protein (TIGR01451 family)
MMIINGANPGTAVFQKSVTLTAGSSVKFNYWVHNLMNINYNNYAKPQIGAQIKNGSGVVVASVSGIQIPIDDIWHQVSVDLLVATTGTYTVIIVSNGPASSGNDYAIDDISIVETNCVADLEITKTASSATPVIGNIIEYTLNVKNNGPDTASAPIITDILPAGLQYQSTGTINIPSTVI